MVSTQRVSEFQRLIEAENLGGRWLPEIPEAYYTFAGEIPWCKTFPANGLTDFYFEIGRRSRKVLETQFRFLCQGRELTEEEVAELVEKKLKPALQQRRKTTTIVKILKSEQITVEEIQNFRDEEESITKKWRVLIPVRDHNWESYHSGVNPGQHAIIPAREIAETLDLWIQLPSWDMYDTDGHRASITINWGESWRVRNHLTYIRQDLLECFLKTKRMTLIWAAWGERVISFSQDEILGEVNHTYNFQSFKVFQRIYK
jgi:hypothetical protein